MLMLIVMFFNDVVDVIDFIKSINVVLFVYLSMLMFTLLCAFSYCRNNSLCIKFEFNKYYIALPIFIKYTKRD